MERSPKNPDPMIHRHSTSIPLHRVAVVSPFAQFLDEVGTPVEQGFRLAGLPFYALEDVNNFVPSQRFWSFVINMARSQGIEDLGFRVGEKFGAHGADPKMTRLLRESPTLFTGLLKASELINKTITHCRLGLLQPPDSRYTLFFHSPSCNADNPAIEQIGWYGLMSLLGMVRIFAGPKWHPAEVGVMTRHAPCRYIREQLWGTRIRLSQPYSYIGIENALLPLPPIAEERTDTDVDATQWHPLSNEFVGSLRQVLQAYLQEEDLNVQLAATLTNTSIRSLQRKLSGAGTHYSAVLDQARLDVARRLLNDPGLKIADVARRLGYRNATDFTRSFRRLTGTTPRDYRQSMTHH